MTGNRVKESERTLLVLFCKYSKPTSVLAVPVVISRVISGYSIPEGLGSSTWVLCISPLVKADVRGTSESVP